MVLRDLPDQCVNCCVTSPPYWGLRDYGVDGQMGLERSPWDYITKMVELFREVRRVLRDDGTLWLNLGDAYAGSWGNYGGQNRGAGKQRAIVSGSRVENPAWDERTKRVPPQANFFRTNRGEKSSKLEGSGNVASQDRLPPVSGLKRKDLIGMPWRVAFAMQADGWWLRSDIIWEKKNCMPESVTDRPTRSHEYIFLLTKSERYAYDHEAIKEPCSESFLNDSRWETGPTNRNEKNGYDKAGAQNPKSVHRLFKKQRPDKQRGHSRRHDGFNDRWDHMEKAEQCSGLRNKRDVWTVAPANYPDAHFATYPPDLIKPCILAGCPVGGVVLDPFAGSGTTGQVALELGRRAVLIELNPEYVKLIEQRCATTPGLPL